jgi:hypothetical protein
MQAEHCDRRRKNSLCSFGSILDAVGFVSFPSEKSVVNEAERPTSETTTDRADDTDGGATR